MHTLNTIKLSPTSWIGVSWAHTVNNYEFLGLANVWTILGVANRMIKETDMSEAMQQEAVKQAEKAVELHTVEKDVAAYIKKYFDRKYSAPWHCIVGQNFGR